MRQIPRHRLDAARLVELTRRYADDVSAGCYPQIRFDAEQRWHERVYADGEVDVWLISWMPAQSTELHDHGGSSGAFAVVAGQLSEAVYVPAGAGQDRVIERVRGEGESVGFSAYHVHDVRNLGERPAVSVHAYSPPLDLMNYYDLSSGSLTKIASLATHDPEATPPAAVLAGVGSGIAS